MSQEGGAAAGGNPTYQMSDAQLQGIITGVTNAVQAVQQQQQLQQQQQSRGFKKLTILTSTDASDWRTWRANFTVVAQINGWDEIRQRREIAAAMEGDAKKSTMDIDHEVAGTGKDLLDAYEARFVTQASSDLSRVTFMNAKQRPDETILAWHARVRDAFHRAYPGVDADTSRALIDRFILGLTSGRVVEYVWDRRPATFSSALTDCSNKMASLAVIANRNRSHHQGGMAANPMMNIKTEPGVRSMEYHQQGYNQPRNYSTNVTCWICNKQGHVRDECPYYLKSLQYMEQLPRKGGRPTGGAGGAMRNGGGRFYPSKKNATGMKNTSGPKKTGGAAPRVNHVSWDPMAEPDDSFENPIYLVAEEDEEGNGENVWSFPQKTSTSGGAQEPQGN